MPLFRRMMTCTGSLLVILSVVLMSPAHAINDGVSWLNHDWSHRVRLTAKPEELPPVAELQDFPLLISLSGDSLATLFDSTKADGSDLLITSGDGITPLPHELVSYDAVEATAELWFLAPQLSSTKNVFYLYYGNPDTTITPVTGAAWGSEHLAVYHFDDDPASGVLSDSGPYDAFALGGSGSGWTTSDREPGQVGSAWNFDGTSKWLYSDRVSASDSSFTISTWASQPMETTSGRLAFQSLSGFWNVSFQRSGGDTDSDLETSNGYMTWNSAIDDNVMHHYSWVLDAEADTARFYFDGVEQPVRVYYAPGAPFRVYTGETIGERVGIAGPAFFNELDLMKGLVDEYRIVSGVRDGLWISTEHNNQRLGEAFYSYEVQAAPISTGVDPLPGRNPGRIAVWPNPFQFAAQIDVQHAGDQLSVKVYDLSGRCVRVLRPRSSGPNAAHLSWDGLDQGGAPVSSGVYYVRAIGPRTNLSTKVLLVR